MKEIPGLIVGLDRNGSGDAVVMSDEGFFIREEGVWRKGMLSMDQMREDFVSVRDPKVAKELLYEALRAIMHIENKELDEEAIKTKQIKDVKDEVEDLLGAKERLLKSKEVLMRAKMKILERIKIRNEPKENRKSDLLKDTMQAVN